MKIGIRREDKNKWERRVPLVPEDIKKLIEEHKIDVMVQPSDIRIFNDKEYVEAGAVICEDLSDCDVVFAVKEIPEKLLVDKQSYVYFSHVIKGQEYNMSMLKRLLDGGCNLIDYEKITDDSGRRLIFFGRFAGIAGMLDTLWTLGRKFSLKGIENPFSHMKRTFEYSSLSEALDATEKAGERIKTEGLPEQMSPLTFGVAGYGNVSKGAQEVLDKLPVREISPQDLLNGKAGSVGQSCKEVVKIVFKECDMAVPEDENSEFNLQQYWKDPSGYKGNFDRFLPHISCLVNCIFWNNSYPRLLSLDWLKNNWEKTGSRLSVIGDISCDIDGGIEITDRCTTPDKPALTWISEKGGDDGVQAEGISVVAVDNLPCELAKDSSEAFSAALLPFVPAITKADFNVHFNDLELPDEIKKATIVHRGELTDSFKYLQRILDSVL